MLRLFDGLREEYKGKKIYVWNVNNSSAILWMDLGMRQINVCGFVVPDDEYAVYVKNPNLYNRPIISLGNFSYIQNAILVTSDDVVSIQLEDLPSNVICRCCNEILGLNHHLADRNIYVYGAGKGADSIIEKLNTNRLSIEGFCQTKRADRSELHGVPVKVYQKNDYTENDVMVIAVTRDDYKDEILNTLLDFPGDVYLDDVAIPAWKFRTLLPQVLYRVVKCKSSLYIISNPDLVTSLVERFIQMYEIPVAGRICPDECQNWKEAGLYSLIGKDMEKTAVFFNIRNKQAHCSVMEILRRIGFSIEIPNIAGMQFCDDGLNFLTQKNKYVSDSLLETAISFNYGESKVWKVMKPSVDADLSIIILGGSTSTAELYYPESWMSKLQNKLRKHGINVIFYVGGTPGRHVAWEFLALLRDGNAIKPDIVISMSGVNNTLTGKKPINQFNTYNVYMRETENKVSMGMSVEEDVFDFWLRVERMIEMYCQHIGASFFCFLQPMNLYMKEMSLDEKLQFETEENILGSRLFFDKSRDDDFYTNLYGLLHHMDRTYFDECHYTDAGAEILSDKVLEKILPKVRHIINRKQTLLKKV